MARTVVLAIGITEVEARIEISNPINIKIITRIITGLHLHHETIAETIGDQVMTEIGHQITTTTGTTAEIGTLVTTDLTAKRDITTTIDPTAKTDLIAKTDQVVKIDIDHPHRTEIVRMARTGRILGLEGTKMKTDTMLMFSLTVTIIFATDARNTCMQIVSVFKQV
jgi:hypothetical protein